MAGINRFTIDTASEPVSSEIFDEGVCGIVFDISKRGRLFIGYPLAMEKYNNEQVQMLTSMEDVEATGITKNGILGGVPYYHLKHFFTMAGKDTAEHVIYVVFANCSSNFDVLHRMMHQTKRRIFQFGIWTEQDLFDYRGTELVSPLLSKLSASIFCFKESFQRSDEYDQEIPFNVLLSANTARTEYVDTIIHITDEEESMLTDENGNRLIISEAANKNTFTYRTLPKVNAYDIPGLTVLIGQECSDEVHNIQEKGVDSCPVGCVGAALGVLSICPAECYLADNSQFSLKDIIPVAELGLGDNHSPISNFNYIRRNEIDAAGYVFLVDREDAPGETFFSGDRTLGKRDYNSLVRCRVINKVHRIIRRTLLEYANAPIKTNPQTGRISQSMCTAIANDMYNNLDTYMGVGSSLNGSAQLDYRKCTVPAEQDVVGTKTLYAEVEIKPGDHSESIIIAEQVILS